nr:MAG TPA: minor tail protein [Caudoviricetes sp.]
MEEIENKLKKADMGFEFGDTQKLEAQYSKLARKLDSLNKKQQELNKNDLSNLRKNIDNVGNGISKTVSKVGKWALAVFAVSSAYSLVRNAMSTLTQYNDQMQSNLQYIQYALTSTLKPLIETILNLVVKLLQYVNYIAQAWFGINLFGGAKDFKSMADSSKQTAKNVKETKKNLVGGIDEITNLDSDKNDSSNSGADSGIKMPSFDLNSIDGPVPSWLQWIVDNKDLILSVMAGVTAGLLAWKLGLGGLKSFGLGIAIAGIVYMIQAVMDYLKDPSWQNFGKIITGIGIAIAGIAIMFGAWPVAIAGAIVAIIGIITSNWENIKSFLQGGVDWLFGKSDLIHKMFGNLFGGVYDSFVAIIQNILNIFDNTFTMLKGVLDGLIDLIKGVFTGNWEQAWNGIVKIFGSIFTGLIKIAGNTISIIWNVIKGLALTVADVVVGVFKTVVNGVLHAIETILNKPINTINLLVGVINKVPGINIGKLPTFKLPRLAKGGIVNNPGKGVNMGSYVAGEKGAEAIVPLQNSKFISDFASQVAEKMGNNDTNTQLLIDLNKNILELANQPIYFRVNGKDLAQATYDDFQNEGKRQQKSATVVRS